MSMALVFSIVCELATKSRIDLSQVNDGPLPRLLASLVRRVFDLLPVDHGLREIFWTLLRTEEKLEYSLQIMERMVDTFKAHCLRASDQSSYWKML